MSTTITIKTRDELIAKFEEIDSSYTVFYAAIYPDLKLQRRAHVALTAEDISALAASLTQGKSAESALLTAEKERVLADFTARAEAAAEQREEGVATSEARYTDALSSLEGDVLSRGMQKSAWYLAEKDALLAAKNAQLDAISAEYADKCEALGAERLRAETEYDAKIARASALYLTALAETERRIKAEDIAQAEAVLEYNNKQTEEEIRYNLQAVNSVFDRANEDTVTRTSMMYEKLRACYDYLSNFTPQNALLYARNDDIYDKYLGSYGKDALVTYYTNLVNSQAPAT